MSRVNLGRGDKMGNVFQLHLNLVQMEAMSGSSNTDRNIEKGRSLKRQGVRVVRVAVRLQPRRKEVDPKKSPVLKVLL